MAFSLATEAVRNSEAEAEGSNHKRSVVMSHEPGHFPKVFRRTEKIVPHVGPIMQVVPGTRRSYGTARIKIPTASWLPEALAPMPGLGCGRWTTGFRSG